MTREYRYKKCDNSLLSPLLEQKIVPWLLPRIPRSIPANIITIASNAIWYLLTIAVVISRGNGLFLIAAIGIVLYTIGDFLDGEQAKRTGTRSPLGDFLDHYLDSFNNGMLVFIMVTLFGGANVFVYAVLLVVSYPAGTALVYEHRKSGTLYFGKIGTTEGLFLSAGILALAAFEPVRLVLSMDVVTVPLFGTLSVFVVLFIVLSFIAYIPTLLGVFRRIGRPSHQFMFFVLGVVVIGLVGPVVMSPGVFIAVVTLYCGVYIGRLHYSRVMHTSEPNPDVVLPVLIVGASLFEGGSSVVEFLVLLPAAQVMWILAKTIVRLREWWVWVNPKEPMEVIETP